MIYAEKNTILCLVLLEEKMKQKTNTYMFIELRRHVIILLVMIITLLFLIIGMSLLNATAQKNATNIVNELGRQRMLTQMIAKDASRVSVLLNAISSGAGIESDEILKEKATDAREKIISSTKSFEATLEGVKKGYIKVQSETVKIDHLGVPSINSNIGEIDALWNEYKRSAYIIVSEEHTSKEFKNALIFINGNNLKLLDLNEKMMNMITERMNGAYLMYRNLYLALILLVSLLSGITVSRLYNYLFKPLEELYMGFNNIGLMSDNDGHSFKTKNNINRVVMEVKNLFSGISEMMHLIENINMHASFDETLDYIFKTFKRYIPYTYIGIALFREYGDENIVASYGVCGNEHRGLETELLGTAVDINKTSLKRIIEKNRPRVINDLDAYFKNKTISDYSRIIMKHGVKASITLPLLINNKQIGFIFFSSNKKNVYSPLHVDFLKSVSNAIAISFEKNIFVDDLVYSSVLALAKLAEAKDDDTAEHLNRMKKYVVLISNLLKTDSKYSDMIDSKFLIDIEKFSPMHDIGKVGIPDNILLKPGRLTGEEFEVMKKHTVYGADVLKEAEANIMRSGRSLFSEGISIALAHHEKWDGSGYPSGLRGDEIPLSARIVALADVLDALLSRRPYKEPFTFEKSVEIIMDGKGKHFDPHIVDVFAGNIDLFRNMHEQFES